MRSTETIYCKVSSHKHVVYTVDIKEHVINLAVRRFVPEITLVHAQEVHSIFFGN